jgi:hypothetical protein
MKLLGCKAFDFNGLDSTRGPCRSYGPSVGGVQPQEPIHVQVRIRQYGDALPEIRRGHTSGPNLGRLPVGAMLDCYV